eukprot:scaffold6594_cov162-Amphora_coffeaeformis.AAC.10
MAVFFDFVLGHFGRCPKGGKGRMGCRGVPGRHQGQGKMWHPHSELFTRTCRHGSFSCCQINNQPYGEEEEEERAKDEREIFSEEFVVKDEMVSGVY